MIYQSIILKSSTSNFKLTKEFLENIGIVHNTYRPELNLYIQRSDSKESIGIKEVRALIDWNALRSEGLRLGIILEAERLTIESQNSLLKVVEEPSVNTLIILQTTNPRALLQTIRSRCRLVNVDKFNIQNNNKEEDLNTHNEVKLKESELLTFLKELLSTNFVQRQKKLEKFIAEESRENIKKLILIAIDELIEKEKNIESTRKLDMIEFLKKTYLGAKGSTNGKLIASSLNLILEDLKA